MTFEELEKIIELDSSNIVCKQFCIFPNEIASCIDSIVFGSTEYVYVLIGVIKDGMHYRYCGIDKHMKMDNIIQSALKQVQTKTEISYEKCIVDGKYVCVIKIKTCDKIQQITDVDYSNMETILRDLLSACVKLQANSIYYGVTEDQRNDYIRDILETAGYDVKDQTRRGISPSGKAAGEVDILINQQDFPITIIEALNLDSLNTTYLHKHIDKIYDYDTAGNKFNIILSYVTVVNFVDFCKKYLEHIERHKYPFSILSVQENVIINGISYADIKVMKTVHNRNNCETALYHVCILMKGKD